MIVTFYNFQ